MGVLNEMGTESLLALNGDRYFIDESGALEVIFSISLVPITPERPHGLKYSLTLIDGSGHRLVGFDNAHRIQLGTGPSKRQTVVADHKHVHGRVTVYRFVNAYRLIEDFWEEVDRCLKRMKQGGD